jgi:hypothetical protein
MAATTIVAITNLLCTIYEYRPITRLVPFRIRTHLRDAIRPLPFQSRHHNHTFIHNTVIIIIITDNNNNFRQIISSMNHHHHFL